MQDTCMVKALCASKTKILWETRETQSTLLSRNSAQYGASNQRRIGEP
jgi:hypothetical protein